MSSYKASAISVQETIQQIGLRTAELFERTNAGAAELLSRRNGLSPRARQLLLLVDGNRDMKRLSRIFASHELHAYLTVLKAGGFIRAKSWSDRSCNTDKLSTMRETTLVKFLEVTGLAGEPFALRVAKCQSAQELHALVPAMASVIEVSHGPGAARQFAEEVFGR
jgi:hypothetical protein